MIASLRLLCRGAFLFVGRRQRAAFIAIVLSSVFALALAACGANTTATPPTQSRTTLTLSTTTSTADTGLLSVLLAPFEKANNVQVKVVAVGSGQAIELGKRGDADVVLAHAPEMEESFMADGYGAGRVAVMHNDFVLVGPPSDPAGVKGLSDAAAAFSRIAAAKSSFISRGDSSGTHAKEKEVWTKTDLSPSAADSWYLAVGQGMGETLRIAQEKPAYTLADRGTYLATRGSLTLVILVELDPLLSNPYHVMAVDPAKVTVVKNYAMAKRLVDYLVSAEAQRIIADFGKDRYGQPLFFPDAAAR